jgi:HEAT repeat protein
MMNLSKKLFSGRSHVKENCNSSQYSEKDFKGFRKALKSDIPSIRSNAAETLGELADPKAVKYLIKILKKDKDEKIRFEAAYALGKIGDARGVKPLIKTLSDEDDDVREAAMEALVRIGKPAVQSLIKTLGVRAGEPVSNPFKSEGGDIKVIRSVHDYAQEVLVDIGEPAVEPLILAMKNTNKHVRRYVTEALGQIGDKRCIESLIAAFRDQDENVRTFASYALENMKWEPEENESKAYYLLARNKWDKLVKMGKPAVEPLIFALTDPDKNIRKNVLRPLYRITKQDFGENIDKWLKWSGL